MEGVEFLGWIGLAFGVASRIFVPWLNERRLNPDEAQWSWRYLWPQLIAVVIVALLVPFLLSDLDAVGGMPFAAAAVSGWGIADIGRFIDKRFVEKS